MKNLQKLIIITLFAMSFAFTSCSSSGYGCRGKSKWITGYRPDGYGGFRGRHH
jgi:hypothetical protein